MQCSRVQCRINLHSVPIYWGRGGRGMNQPPWLQRCQNWPDPVGLNSGWFQEQLLRIFFIPDYESPFSCCTLNFRNRRIGGKSKLQQKAEYKNCDDNHIHIHFKFDNPKVKTNPMLREKNLMMTSPWLNCYWRFEAILRASASALHVPKARGYLYTHKDNTQLKRHVYSSYV